MQQQITYYTVLLQKENYKSFYLAFLRVAICCWLLKELAINWSSLDVLYGQSGFVVAKNNFINRLPGDDFAFVKSHYTLFITAYIIVLFANLLGIGRNFSALLLFIILYLLQKMNMSIVNGGDAFARIILFYLIFADSYQFLILFKEKKKDHVLQKILNLISNLAALSIMLHLCMAYFSAGIAKLIDPVWLQGEGTYYAMSIERFTGTPFNKYLVQYKWIDYFFNYATILFELVFPILIWNKKCRKPLLVAGILFHAFIYIFLMIYGFEVVFILTYGLFLPNHQWINIERKVNAFLKGNKNGLEENIQISSS